jgi:exodeoxyribonuclease VII small subunit
MSESENFEQSMKRLDEIVQRLESGKLSLEESIALYEDGVKLSEKCRKSLTEAQLAVKTINNEGDA